MTALDLLSSVPIHPLSWDLEVVLRALWGGEYEPMADLSFRALTKKTLSSSPCNCKVC